MKKIIEDLHVLWVLNVVFLLMTTLEHSDWGQKTGSELMKTEDEEDLTGNQEDDLVFRLQNVVYL